MLHLRLLPPRSYRLRNRLPEWEITDETGVVVGWIEQHEIPTASRPFYMLRAIHPETGETIPLELSADRDERLAKLAAFRAHPDAFHMHYPSSSRAARALLERTGIPPWQLGDGKPGRHG
jgi:hypothetical protein